MARDAYLQGGVGLEATIITTQGLALRPEAGAEIEFLTPLPLDGERVALEVLVDGRAVRWCVADDRDEALRLLEYAQRRYLTDGAALDAAALRREMER
jgi:hypothetical protein